MNITHIECNLKNLLEKSDQNFSVAKMHMFCRKNVCDLEDIQIRYLVADSHHHAGFTNANKVHGNSIEMYIFEALDEREKHSEKTLAELYDPDKMPAGLRQAYHNLDIAIEQCYCLKPFASNEERLEHLFTIYEQMTFKGTK